MSMPHPAGSGGNPRSGSPLVIAAHGLVWLSLIWVLVLFRRLGSIGLVPGEISPGLSLFETLARYHFITLLVLGLHALALTASIPLSSRAFSPGPKRLLATAAGMLAMALISAFSIGTYFLPSVVLLAASSLLCALGIAPRSPSRERLSRTHLAVGTLLSLAALWGFFAATGIAVLPSASRSVASARDELNFATTPSEVGSNRTASATLAPIPGRGPDSGMDSRWKDAAESIRRLRPSEMTALPDKTVRELEESGCAIPQLGEPFPEAKEPHNFIKGTFSAAGGTDWAALCSRGGRSVIKVVWGVAGSGGNCESDLAPFDDAVFLQGMGDGMIAFSRAISAVDKGYITSHYEAYGGREPPAEITHQGINDAFAEKASTVHYCHEGKWIELSGAD